jgi:PAS domain S-box-containing protein
MGAATVASDQVVRDLGAMRRLHHLSTRFIRAGELPSLIEEIVEIAVAIAHADGGTLQLLDRTSGKLRIAAQRGHEASWLSFFEVVQEGAGSSCGSSLAEGKRVIVDDIVESPLFVGTPALEVQLRAGIRAVQSTPLMGSFGEVVGMLSTHSRRPGRPGDDDLRLLDLLARLAADMIDRAGIEQKLRDREERFHALVTASSSVVYRMSPDWTEMRQLIGREFIPDTDAPSTTWLETYIAPPDQPGVLAAIRRAIDTSSVFELEHRVRRLDGSLGWALSRAVPMRDAAGRVVEWVGTASDITERKRLEVERDRFFQLSPDMMAIASAVDGRWKRVNPALTAVLGWSQEELLATPFFDIVHPDDLARSIEATAALGAGAPLTAFEHRVRCKDGSYRWIAWNMAPYPDEGLTYCAGRDVTERHATDSALRTSLADRETLLREIHHRVKNSLEVIDSLLQLQARAEPDRRLRAALGDTSNRVHAIAEVHHLLHGSTDLASVSLRSYAEKLAASLLEIFGDRSDRLDISVEGPDLHLEIQRAIPAGLILNELLSNALKHAYPGPRAGTVVVALRVDGPDLEICVRDSGVGLPDPLPGDSLGLQLVRVLAQQLGGRVGFDRGVGTTVRVRFPERASGPD